MGGRPIATRLNQILLCLMLVRYGFGEDLGRLRPRPICGMCVTSDDYPWPPSVSCSHLLWGTDDTKKSSCSLMLPPEAPKRNSSECEAFKFDHDIGTAPNMLATVSLKTYYYYDKDTGWRQMAFNVTLSNIKWTNFQMRFQEARRPRINFCRNFTIAANELVPPESKLFYDCLWSPETYESEVYTLEYSASKDSGSYMSVGKFLFSVPNNTEMNPAHRYLNAFKIFSYMDLSDWPLLKLRLQVPEERFFDVSLDSVLKYNVILYHGKMESSHKPIKLSSQASEADENELTYVYDTRYEGGSYYFTIQVDHENCSLYKEGCLISRTPTYFAPEDIHLRLLIGIVGCGGALLSICVFVYFIWRWSRRYKAGDLPTVLIIYAPTTAAHIKCAEEFAKFLQNTCYVNALLDVVEIPKTATQDPFIWCNDAFQHADFVMVLSSPYQQCNNHEGVYRNVDVLGLRHLKEKLGDRNSKQQFFSVILPYCTEKDVPSEVKNLKQFFLPKDFDKLLNFLHSDTYQGEVELEEDGVDFLEALRKAEAEVVAHKCVCSNGQCHKLSLDELDTIDMTPSKDSSEHLLLPPREKTASEALNMYPGPLDELNLLGSDGDTGSVVLNQPQPTKKLVVDLNDLNLG